jgi:ABC-2 type transport system permease protein
MFEILRYETEKRVLSALVITVGLSLYAGLFLAIAPDIIANVDFSAYGEALPEAMQSAFGVDALGSLEGFLAAELYQFGWVLLLGLYFAYTAGGTVAGDVERGRMDMLLSTSVSRDRVVVEKYLALVPTLLFINAVVAGIVYAGALLIGEPVSLADVVAVHALSIPYLLVCASIGLGFSVLVRRESLAQRAGIATVFGLFMVESLVIDTDYEVLGLLSPTRYYDPTEILVESTYDLVGAAILAETALLLVVGSVVWFNRRDI